MNFKRKPLTKTLEQEKPDPGPKLEIRTPHIDQVLDEIRETNMRNSLAERGITGIEAETAINDDRERRKRRAQLDNFLKSVQQSPFYKKN